MEPQKQEYKGHRIELRAPDEEKARSFHTRSAHASEFTDQPEAELLIDDQPVRYDRLPNGQYFLQDYAYDWHDDLMDVARRFIDHQSAAEEGRRNPEADLPGAE